MERPFLQRGKEETESKREQVSSLRGCRGSAVSQPCIRGKRGANVPRYRCAHVGSAEMTNGHSVGNGVEGSWERIVCAESG